MIIKKHLARLAEDQSGLADVEYAFLCGLIVIVMVVALNSMANAIGTTWNNISSQSQLATQQAAG